MKAFVLALFLASSSSFHPFSLSQSSSLSRTLLPLFSTFLMRARAFNISNSADADSQEYDISSHSSDEKESGLVREASHAGTWYEGNASKLQSLIEELFEEKEGLQKHVRALVCPHAGYSYCKDTISTCYKQLQAEAPHTKRIFLLGPHHAGTRNGIFLSQYQSYSTPLGEIPLDAEVIEKFKESKLFDEIDLHSDLQEHSLEMQLPMMQVALGLDNHEYTIVPIFVSAPKSEEHFENFVELLNPYFQDKENFFVVSSDFCHWGGHGGYFYLLPSSDHSDLDASIRELDDEGINRMEKCVLPDLDAYMKETKNPICGIESIRTLIALQNQSPGKYTFERIHYSRSGSPQSKDDYTVSYTCMIVSEK